MYFSEGTFFAFCAIVVCLPFFFLNKFMSIVISPLCIVKLLKKCTYAAFCVETDNEVLDPVVSLINVKKH